MNPRSEMLHLAGFDVNVVHWGEGAGPTVVVLHGGMAHARWWDLVAMRLADRLHVVGLDMPGHGDSPWVDPQRYGHRHQIPIVETLLARLGPGPLTLAGHSHGSLVATLVASGDGSRPARVVLVDMPADPNAPRLVRSGMAFRRMVQPRWTSREEAVAAFRLFPGDGAAPAEALAHVGTHSVRENGEGVWTSKFDWRYFRERPEREENPYADFQERLARLPMPVLVLRGERSTIQSAADHATLLTRIPSATSAVIAGAGHNPHVEQPAATAHAIAQFLGVA